MVSLIGWERLDFWIKYKISTLKGKPLDMKRKKKLSFDLFLLFYVVQIADIKFKSFIVASSCAWITILYIYNKFQQQQQQQQKSQVDVPFVSILKHL